MYQYKKFQVLIHSTLGDIKRENSIIFLIFYIDIIFFYI